MRAPMSNALLHKATDKDLCDGIGLGDAASMGEVVRRYAPMIRIHLRRMGAQPSDADDAAQETFISAFEHIDTFRADGALLSWLKMIATRKFLRLVKKSSRYLWVDDMSAYENDQIEHKTTHIEAKDLDEALKRLSLIERTCVTMNFAQGLTHQMIADETGMPLGTVKSNVRRGLERLRLAFGNVKTINPAKIEQAIGVSA